MDDEDEFVSKFVSEIKCISHVEIKDEVIIPDNTNDSESTLSDNEKSSDFKLKDCSICSKYRSMFIILKNHECQPAGDGKCGFCVEISHWSSCFKNHKDSHQWARESDHSSESTTSDREESEEKCKICLKYEFMLRLLKNHDCKAINSADKKCRDCSEVWHWVICYKNHTYSHETKDCVIKKEEDKSSDSTTSDNEENHKFHRIRSERSKRCPICLKYEVMLIILEENHPPEVEKMGKKCESCDEILHWYSCFENHKRTHPNFEKFVLDDRNDRKSNYCLRNFGGKFDCGICLKLNSIVTQLVKNHECKNNKTCSVCGEASFWLSCLRNHKQLETKSDLSDASDGEEIDKIILTSGNQMNCTVCSKFRSAIVNSKNHVCRRKKGRQRCEICREVSFWCRNFKRHELQHTKRLSSLKNFLSCSNCGKRFSGEKMLNIHKHYCKSSYFRCEICNRGFLDALSLKKHRVFQSCLRAPISLQYKCRICKKGFSNCLDLKNHQGFHDDLKFFKCTECFTKFKSKFCLEKHKMIHSPRNKFCKLEVFKS